MQSLTMRVIVSGRVQGVWFRRFTKEQADANGVLGWVRNLPDGRVEACLSGPANAVRHVEALLYEGPPLAEVIEVQAEELEQAPEAFSEFAIR